MTASFRKFIAFSGIAAMAFCFSLTGCGESDPGQVRGPVEGKRLDGTETALKVPKTNVVPDVPEKPILPDTVVPDAPAIPVAPPIKPVEVKPVEKSVPPVPPVLSDADAKKKRDEWRDKKTGKPDENDPLAQANIALRPSLDPNAKKPAPNVETPGVKDPAKPETQVGEPGAKATATKDDPTSLAKPLVDPEAPVPFVNPNDPNFIPNDRTLYKKFDIKNLKERDGHLIVPFADLCGFPYSGMTGVPQVEKGKEPKKPEYVIPDAIKALHKKKVVIAGYMMPIDFEDGGTNEFVLTRQIPSCFYCIPPQLNDWVEVKMKDGKRVDYVPDGIIEVYGELEVGELIEDGFVVNLFRMTGTKSDSAVTE